MRLFRSTTFAGLFVSLFSAVAFSQPSPVPSPSVRPVSRTKPAPIVLRKGPPIVIRPVTRLSPAPTFDVMGSTAPLKTSGTLIVRFRAHDATQELSKTAPILIDLYGSGKMNLKPFQIMKKDWKPGTQQILVQYSGAIPKKKNTVRGDAAFTICKKGTNVCNKIKKDDLVFNFLPSS